MTIYFLCTEAGGPAEALDGGHSGLHCLPHDDDHLDVSGE